MSFICFEINGAIPLIYPAIEIDGIILDTPSIYANLYCDEYIYITPLDNNTPISNVLISQLDINFLNATTPTEPYIFGAIKNNVFVSMESFQSFNSNTSLISSNNIVINNVDKEQVVVFSEIPKIKYNQFIDLASTYNIFYSFYFNVYDVINDNIYIKNSFTPITIQIPQSLIGDDSNSLTVYKYEDGSTIPEIVIAHLVNNNYEITLTSASTLGILKKPGVYNVFIGDIDVNQEARLYERPYDTYPATYYKITANIDFTNLFSSYDYQQDPQNANLYIINLEYNQPYLDSIIGNIDIESSGLISPLNYGLLAWNGNTNSYATGKENGSINGALTSGTNNLAIRLLEITAIHIFGHGRARAAISNDSEYIQSINTVKQKIVELLTSEIKYKFIEEYVNTGKIDENDISGSVYFDFTNFSFGYKINYGVTNILDSDNQPTSLIPLPQSGNAFDTIILFEFIHSVDPNSPPKNVKKFDVDKYSEYVAILFWDNSVNNYSSVLYQIELRLNNNIIFTSNEISDFYFYLDIRYQNILYNNNYNIWLNIKSTYNNIIGTYDTGKTILFLEDGNIQTN
jgi:hypothetical protein